MPKVLIADDNTLARNSFVDVLTARGYEVLQAENGQEAIDSLESGEVDLAIIDVMMPRMGGLEVRQILEERRPDLPVILITGQPDMVMALTDDDDQFVTGQVSILFKPVHPITLLDQVAKILE